MRYLKSPTIIIAVFIVLLAGGAATLWTLDRARTGIRSLFADIGYLIAELAAINAKQDAQRQALEQLSSIAKKPALAREANRSGCMPVLSLPFAITEPGKYCLKATIQNDDLDFDGITVSADGVEIDGNGYCIVGSIDPDAVNSAIRAIDVRGLQINNICVIGHRNGVLAGGSVDLYEAEYETYGTGALQRARDISVKNSTFTQQNHLGIHVRGENIVVENNSVSHTGGIKDLAAFPTGISVVATNCRISANRVFNVSAEPTSEAVGISLYQGAACAVTGNMVNLFRPAELTRSYGIWTRGNRHEMPEVSNNTVFRSDYAFGPFGAYHQNLGVDIRCAMFVDRIFSFQPNQVRGWLLAEGNEQLTSPYVERCPDDLDFVIERAVKKPTPAHTYAVVKAYGEIDPREGSVPQLAWIFISAELDHPVAKSIVETNPTIDRDPSDLEKAQALLPELRKRLGLVQNSEDNTAN